MGHRIWQPPLLSDVAQSAGVSLATASRVFSETANVAPARQQAVREAARRLGYRHRHAVPSCVAVLVAATDRIGYFDTLAGIIEAARDEQLLTEIHVADTSSKPLTEGVLVRILSQPMIGVIVMEFDSISAELVGSLPADVPISVAGGIAGTVNPAWAHCYIDDRAAARVATEQLLAMGHQTVHYLGVPNAGHQEPRAQGWRQALEAARAPIRPPLGVGWSAERGRRAAHLIAADPGVTAVLCGNDELAIGLVSGLAELGVSVPGEVSVVGFDDHPLAAHCQPPLTTVRQDFAELGRVATKLLLELADLGRPLLVEVKTELVHRASTAAPPAQPRSTSGSPGTTRR